MEVAPRYPEPGVEPYADMRLLEFWGFNKDSRQNQVRNRHGERQTGKSLMINARHERVQHKKPGEDRQAVFRLVHLFPICIPLWGNQASRTCRHTAAPSRHPKRSLFRGGEWVTCSGDGVWLTALPATVNQLELINMSIISHIFTLIKS